MPVDATPSPDRSDNPVTEAPGAESQQGYHQSPVNRINRLMELTRAAEIAAADSEPSGRDPWLGFFDVTPRRVDDPGYAGPGEIADPFGRRLINPTVTPRRD